MMRREEEISRGGLRVSLYLNLCHILDAQLEHFSTYSMSMVVCNWYQDIEYTACDVPESIV